MFDPNYVANLAHSITASAAAEQRLTNQLSSGLRVSTLSDDPVAASSNVLLSNSIARLDSFVQSSASVQSRLQVTDGALGEVVSQITSALSTAVSASNGTHNPTNLAAIASKISDIRDNVVALANTSYLGAYVFAGSQGTTRPFALDPTTGAPTYSGDSATQSLETPDGQRVPTNLPGSAIFTAPTNNLLSTLNDLVAHLRDGTTSALPGDTAALSAALSNVTTQRSTIGTSLARLNLTSSYARTQQTTILARQSDLLSADPAQVASDLKTAEVQHQALLGVEAALDKNNLFDYIR